MPETGLMGFNNPQQLKGMLGIATALTDIFLQVKIGADMALLQAIEILLLKEEEKSPGSVFDQSFIEKNTDGYPQFIQHLKTLNLDDLIQHTGIDKTQVTEAANILKTKNKIIACGLLKPIRPVSGSGFIEMMMAPFAFAFCRAVSILGWLVPGFCPRMTITSAS